MTQPPDDRLHWTARFADPAAERAYRLARLPDKRSVGRTLILALVGMNLLFVPLDLLSLGPTPRVLLSAAVKLVVVGWSLGCRRWVGRAADPDGFDRRLTAWAVPVVVLDVAALALHHPGHLGSAAPVAVAVVLAYLLPLPLRWAAGVGLGLSALFVALLFGHAAERESGHGRWVAAAGFALANALGATAGRLVQADRRRQFAAAVALERAAAELRTLRGLLPICASCKSIRDDAGDWQRLEKYIQTHTPATFTHGICPGCLANEYGLTPDGRKLPTVAP